MKNHKLIIINFYFLPFYWNPTNFSGNITSDRFIITIWNFKLVSLINKISFNFSTNHISIFIYFFTNIRIIIIFVPDFPKHLFN